MRALIYTRVSQDKRQQGRSVEEQEAECQAFCAREGWTVVGVVSDNDRSASRYAKKAREGWATVTKRLASGRVDVLVTWEASRSQRDLEVFVELRKVCRINNVKLSYSGRTLDLNKSEDAFSAGMDALIGERYSDETKERIDRALRANAVAGRPHGRRLYGYRRIYDESTGALLKQVPDPLEAPIVLEMAKRILSGESAYSIVQDLNKRGIPTITGKPWESSRVKSLLTNPAFVAQRVHQGAIIGAAGWDPILSQDDYDRLQALYEDPSRSKFRQRSDVKYLLTGIARCGLCGGRMYRGHDRNQRHVYMCRPGKGHVVRDLKRLDAFVISVVVGILEREDLVLTTPTDDPSVLRARAEAIDLKQRLDDATQAFTAGKIRVATLAKIEADLLPKIASAEAHSKTGVVSTAAEDLAGPDAAARWDAASIEVQRQVVIDLLDVVVHPSIRPRGSKGFDSDSVEITPKF